MLNPSQACNRYNHLKDMQIRNTGSKTDHLKNPAFATCTTAPSKAKGDQQNVQVSDSGLAFRSAVQVTGLCSEQSEKT